MKVLTANRTGISMAFKAATGLFVALLLTLGLLAGSASAASTHTPVTEWSTGENCGPRSVATDAAGNVYVMCSKEGGNELKGAVRKFSASGTPISFTKSAPYISGNEINRDPGSSQNPDPRAKEQFGCNGQIAVDKSSTRPGYIYVASPSEGCFGGGSNAIDVFAPSGEYITSLRIHLQDGAQVAGIDIDSQGYIYAVIWAGCCSEGHVSKYSPVDFHEIERWNPGGFFNRNTGNFEFFAACCNEVKVDNTGATWSAFGNPFFDETSPVGKVEADQFTTDLIPGPKDSNLIAAKESPYLKEKFEMFPGTECPPAEVGGGFFLNAPCYLDNPTDGDFDTDQHNNDLYLIEEGPGSSSFGNEITPYSQGKPGDPVHQDGPTFGLGTFAPGGGSFQEGRHGLEVDPSGVIYVTNPQEEKITRFARGLTLPTVTTHPAAITDIGHEEALLRGIVDPMGGEGGTSIEDCEVVVRPLGTPLPETGTAGDGVPCNEATPFPSTGREDVTATVTGLEAEHLYHYRFEATNSAGENLGGERVFEARAVLDLETKPAPPDEIEKNQAMLEGQLNPDNLATEYWYEYGPDKTYGLQTHKVPISGTGIKPTPLVVEHLQAGKTFHFRLAASNVEYGTTHGQDMVFRTASPPEITGVGTENVQETSADIHLKVNPAGFDTSYVVEYGNSSSYGSTIPGSGEDIGSGLQPVERNLHLAGLTPNATIHFRVVATNKWGTSATDDTTFNYAPPACPNAHVRQLTSSSYLPDCRAYELVTPGYAGAVQIMPGEALAHFGENFGTFAQGPQNFGFATNPGRFVFMGSLGAVNEQPAVNGFIDMYLANRTSTGWVTTFPNLKGSETSKEWGFSCSESMELCISHIGELVAANEETGEIEYLPPQNSPYLYKADGSRITRLPTNVNTVPGGTTFKGDQMLSGDFSHFVLSTRTPFVPGGPTTEPGAVYDNDIKNKTIQIVSQTPGGEIPSLMHDERPTGIAAVSSNGSHILMAATTSKYCNVFVYGEFGFRCPYILASPTILYERVNDAVTREVTKGELAHYVGMSKDGSRVDFTTTAQLVPEDDDTSSDMYQYNADTNKWTLVSQEGSLGNTDACTSTWTEKCGVQPITPERVLGSEGFQTTARTPGPDDQIAYGNGDVYFYSPEDLVPGEVGGEGQRNLYLYHDGHLRLVSTFEPGTEVTRATIAGDGGHAAFLTKSSLTPYDSERHDEVYAYTAETNIMHCASCNPSGAKPKDGAHVVTVSESGPFMSDDGRTFFATQEALVPQDTDGIRDVYEYTEGHAQLISSGTGDRENTGGLETVSFFFGNTQTGLESVSRDGTDVYYSTFETLVPEDKNGSFVKIYDARTNGGFDFTPQLGSCSAADECHGAGSEPPAPPLIATGGSLGGGGNVPQGAARKHRRHRKHHAKQHRKNHHSKHRRNKRGKKHRRTRAVNRHRSGTNG
jgi:hypothetical protein